jgi:bacteriocin biosynthesis cyclodehydratase domain-containing protein
VERRVGRRRNGVIPELPYLAPWYRITSADDAVVLEYGQRIICLAGRAGSVLVPVLLPLLDGTRTLGEIVEVLGEPARPAIEAALERLTEYDLLVDGPPLPQDAPRPLMAIAHLLASLRPSELAPHDVAASLGTLSVGVVGSGAAAVEIARLLRESGVEVSRSETISGDVDLVVCAPAPQQLPTLPEWNSQALVSGQPWLQVLPFDGRYACVGPLYVPAETCCFECFRRRRSANLHVGDELALLEATPAAYPVASCLLTLIAGVAATVALQWLVLRDHGAPSAFYAIEVGDDLALTRHHVHRVPRCSACSGVADVAAPLPWYKEHAAVGR